VNEDDEWSYAHLADHEVVEECSAGRSVIDGMTHRVLRARLGSVDTGWCTLCDRQPARPWAGWTPELVDCPVDCMACITAGG
jgi:hypothetical protein